MAELFKLAFYADDGIPLKVPKQAAVIGELCDRTAKDAEGVVLDYFLGAVCDEELEQAAEAAIVRMDLSPWGSALPKRRVLTREMLQGSILSVRLKGVSFFKAGGEAGTPWNYLPGVARPVTSWGTVSGRGRMLRMVSIDNTTCVICNKTPGSTIPMVATPCGDAFCDPCLSSFLGCRCDRQGISWLVPCSCTGQCPKCGATIDRQDFKAVRPPATAAAEPNKWRFLSKPYICECGMGENPRFALPGSSNPSRKGRWCELCPTKPANAVDVTFKTCECGKGICMMGLPGDQRKDARWCRQCPYKPPEAITLVWKRCKCGHSEPYFGLPGERRSLARWCSKCPTKPPFAVDIVHKRCECGSRRPSMGLPGGQRKDAKWCLQCPMIPAVAVNLLATKCECGRVRPTFAFPGQTRKDAKWCSQCPHRPEGTIDVVTLKCSCGKSQAYFGLPWDSAGKAKWCSSCPDIPPNAVDVRHKKCMCGISKAVYCLPGEIGIGGSAKWCSNCRPTEAVRFYQNKCECGRTQPSYGIPGMKVNGRMAVWCAKCPTKPAAAINVTTSKKRKAQ